MALAKPVPPRDTANCPDHPAVIEVACKSAVAGVPPNVNVTLVSSTLVKAAGLGSWEVVASVGTAGQVLTSNGAGALPTFQNASGGADAAFSFLLMGG